MPEIGINVFYNKVYFRFHNPIIWNKHLKPRDPEAFKVRAEIIF